MSKLLIGSIILIVLGIIVIAMAVNSNSNITENVVSENDVKTFVLTGENFKFVMDGKGNPDIVVNEGDKVRIEFSSTKGLHDFVIDELDVATPQLRDTEEETFVEFVADKKGTFEYYCSVGQHRENGMKGNFIVN